MTGLDPAVGGTGVYAPTVDVGSAPTVAIVGGDSVLSSPMTAGAPSDFSMSTVGGSVVGGTMVGGATVGGSWSSSGNDVVGGLTQAAMGEATVPTGTLPTGATPATVPTGATAVGTATTGTATTGTAPQAGVQQVQSQLKLAEMKLKLKQAPNFQAKNQIFQSYARGLTTQEDKLAFWLEFMAGISPKNRTKVMTYLGGARQ